MERSRILEYLAKMVLNTRAEETALKDEENRLKARRERLERKEDHLMAVLDRECGGEKMELEIATISYRKSEKVNVNDETAAMNWLKANGHDDCYRVPEPEILKSEIKKLLARGEEVPGTELVESISCNLK